MAAGALLLVTTAVIARITGVQGVVPADGRDWLLALLCAPIGARIAAHAPRNASGWLILALALLAAGTVAASAVTSPVTDWLRLWLWWPSYGLVILVALLFPTGKPVSPRWRWVVATVAAAVALGTAGLISLAGRAADTLLDGVSVITPGWDTVAVLLSTVALFAGALAAVVALVVRIWRAPPPGRGPLIWGGVNGVLLVTAIAVETVEHVPLIGLVGVLAMPAAAAVGVVRYGLYDIDMLVHRSLSYGLLTAAGIAVYAGVAVLASRFVQPSLTPVVAVTAVVALLPLRDRLQSLLRRHRYGAGARPYEVLTTLNHRLGLARTPEQVLATAVAAVGEALHVPFVAVHLVGRPEPESTHGRRRQWPVTQLPLTYQDQEIGHLEVQQRGPDEPWSAHEQALLNGLAGQLGPSAASVRLTRDLQAARERLVRAREEELRRLQRDLHDGIGPSLSGARMLARSARAGTGDHAVRHLLDNLDQGLTEAGTELRRIIDNLRPGALERGLPTALETAAQRHRSPELEIAVSIHGDLTQLPAAVEVAVYRLVDEALTNVVKHAEACQVQVLVTREPDRLCVDVIDDGVGPGPHRADGVGLDSMRQRCQELGGDCTMTGTGTGTRVRASIPVG